MSPVIDVRPNATAGTRTVNVFTAVQLVRVSTDIHTSQFASKSRTRFEDLTTPVQVPGTCTGTANCKHVPALSLCAPDSSFFIRLKYKYKYKYLYSYYVLSTRSIRIWTACTPTTHVSTLFSAVSE